MKVGAPVDRERRKSTMKRTLTALTTVALAMFAFPTSFAYFFMAFLLAPMISAGFTPVFTEKQSSKTTSWLPGTHTNAITL